MNQPEAKPPTADLLEIPDEASIDDDSEPHENAFRVHDRSRNILSISLGDLLRSRGMKPLKTKKAVSK